MIEKPCGARRKMSRALDSCFGLVCPHQQSIPFPYLQAPRVIKANSSAVQGFLTRIYACIVHMFQLRAVISVLKRRRKRRRQREKEATSSVGSVLYSGRSKMENTGAATAYTATYHHSASIAPYKNSFTFKCIILVYNPLVSVAQSKIVAWCLLHSKMVARKTSREW